MTCNELSTLVRHKFAPVVFVLDNGGYGTERVLHDGNWEYNEIHGWNYSRLVDVYRGGTGYEVRTEQELADAVDKAFADKSGLSLIHVKLDHDEYSDALNRMGASGLGERV